MYVARVSKLYKTYNKLMHPVKALNGISFSIEKGSTVGLVGPNGAGKSTLIKIMVSLLSPDSGHVHLRIKKPVGYVEEEPVFLDLNVYENIMYLAELHRIPGEKIKVLLKKFGLINKRREYPNNLSHGQKKRLALLRAIIHQPEFLILDEPFSGLDPSMTLWMRDFIEDIKKRGKTIFISSHILSHLMPICDRIIFMDHGKILLDYRLKKMPLFRIFFKGEIPKDIEAEKVDDNSLLIKCEREEIPQIVEILVKNKIKIYEIRPEGIEEIYERLYGGGKNEWYFHTS